MAWTVKLRDTEPCQSKEWGRLSVCDTETQRALRTVSDQRLGILKAIVYDVIQARKCLGTDWKVDVQDPCAERCETWPQ